jgi:hypothetical protein
MNERIDKLFEQALEEFKAENKYATIIVPNPLKEKFAQLIVRECASIASNPATGCYTSFGNDIKKHFGVEE